MNVTSSSVSLEPTDRALADQVIRDGAESAFRALYRRHTPGLYQFVLRLVGGNEHDADDVVQDTWVRAVQKLGSFRWRSALKTWLFGIALNRCRELFRRKDRNWLEVSEDLELKMVTPSHHERIDLEVALRNLPEGYRAVLVLHDVEGYTHDQIGDMLEVTPGTSKSQLFHARRMMRTLLAPTSGADARIPR